MFNKLRLLYHYLLAWVGNEIYKRPSKKLYVIGVTGTKGKSTVLELMNAILEAAGKRTALSSSVRFKIDFFNESNNSGMSMPGRFFIQRFLSEAFKRDCEYALIEVTSQGILQFRHRFVDFDAALLTNLEPEHIEAHGSFTSYRDTKARFFRDAGKYSLKQRKLFFLNSDARDVQYFVDAVKGRGLPGQGNVVFYNKKDMRALKIKTKLIGEFNLENIAAAIAFARSRNIDWETIRSAIESFDGVPGRLEFVQKIPFPVIIDYAHTPDSLEKVYQTGRKTLKKSKKMICVLGSAGGGRDMWKRPVMGGIASKYCDRIILTNEDPFDEDPMEILNQIESGIMDGNKKKIKKILDRKEAIRAAIKSAKKDDLVIITGKGCEPHMRVAKNKKIPWNEKEIVLKILNNEKIEI